MDNTQKPPSFRAQPKPTVVGAFLKKRREELGISQKALGALFEPPVTTQFVSNVERGVTPLPASHVTHLAKALQVPENEFLAVLEKDYAQRLTTKLGKQEFGALDLKLESSFVPVPTSQEEFWKRVVQYYQASSPDERENFHRFCQEAFKKAA